MQGQINPQIIAEESGNLFIRVSLLRSELKAKDQMINDLRNQIGALEHTLKQRDEQAQAEHLANKSAAQIKKP